MARKPPLTIVGSTAAPVAPPRQLGRDGMALWHRVMNEYCIEDAGGRELLYQACAATDRTEAHAAQIDHDGALIRAKGGLKEHPLLKAELAGRAFICRTLQRLGLNLEVVKPPGRPAAGFGWIPPDDGND